MSDFRFARLARLPIERAAPGPDLWPLSADHSIQIGRGIDGEVGPEVDLRPDRRVSRTHARVWYEGGGWWIEDRDSAHGTWVDGQEIQGGGPVPLESGTEIQVGDTTLLFAPPHWHRLRRDGLVIDLEVIPTVSAALVHGDPGLVVPRLTVRNWSDAPLGAARLRIAIAQCGQTEEISTPPLQPDESRDVRPPAFKLEDGIASHLERSRRRVTVWLDGQPLPSAEPLDCLVLAHNEWSYAEEHRLSLAAFVLCNHPRVVKATLEACAHLGEGEAADPQTVLAALYDYFHARWHLVYRREPPHADVQSQRIRLPHEVLSDVTQRQGQGTCLDLALLFAACLERVHLQPLVAILEIGAGRHALVGCWQEVGPRLESLLVADDPADQRRLLERLRSAIWVDPTGCTWDPTHPSTRMEFARSCLVAAQFLARTTSPGGNLRWHFGLDVAAARTYDSITPLPFAGEPEWSEAAQRARQAAVSCAAAVPTQLSTVPLLIGLLSLEDGITREAWPPRLGDVAVICAQLTGELPPRPDTTQPSDGYQRACRLAQDHARAEGSPLVLEEHLLAGLLETPSEALDDALAWLGTARAELQTALRALQGESRWGEPTSYSVFSKSPPPSAN